MREYGSVRTELRLLNIILLGRDARWPFRNERVPLSLALMLSTVEHVIGVIARDSCSAKGDLRGSRTEVLESGHFGPGSAAEWC